MDHGHLPRHEGLDDLCPGAEQTRLVPAQALGLEELAGVGDEQRRGRSVMGR